MSSIQAFIFRPRAPKLRVVVRYVEEMVNSKVRAMIIIYFLHYSSYKVGKLAFLSRGLMPGLSLIHI